MSVLDLIPQTEKETLKFRLLALLAVAVAFLFQWREAPLLPALAIVGGYLFYSYFLRTFLIPRFTSYPLLGGMMLLDVGILIVALHLIGLDSPIFGLLPIAVVYYAVYVGYLGGVATGTVSVAGYTGLVLAKDQVTEMERLLAIQPFFFVLALLVGYITQQRFRESQERRSLQQVIGAEAFAKSLPDLAQAMNRVMHPSWPCLTTSPGWVHWSPVYHIVLCLSTTRCGTCWYVAGPTCHPHWYPGPAAGESTSSTLNQAFPSWGHG